MRTTRIRDGGLTAAHADYALLDPEDLRRHVAAHLAAFKVPSQVFVFAEPLPRNASGKLLLRALRDQVVAGRGSSSSSA